MNRLPPFKFFVLQNFPFIEEDFDALTNYELMCKIVEYVKKIADTTNTLGTEIETFVNWFNNLDVQEEIDNKLDEMAESGELAEIINQEIFNELNAKINLLTKERIVCIGDSYGTGRTAETESGYTDGWPARIKVLRNIANADFYNFSENAAGFVTVGHQGHTFQTLLESNISNVTNPETITKILVCGGHNDYDSSGPDLNATIRYFINYCKQHFINAKIYFGMIGNDSRTNTAGKDTRNDIYAYILRSWQNSVRYGAIYLAGVENIMHDYATFMSDDGIHPNIAGYDHLAGYINSGLDGQYADYVSNILSKTFTATNSESTFYITTKIINDVITFGFNQEIEIGYETPFTWYRGVYLELADSSPYNFAFHNRYIKIPVYYYCQDTSDNYYGGVGFVEFRENKIVLRNAILLNDGEGYPDIENVRRLVIQPQAITVENGIC